MAPIVIDFVLALLTIAVLSVVFGLAIEYLPDEIETKKGQVSVEPKHKNKVIPAEKIVPEIQAPPDSRLNFGSLLSKLNIR